MKAKELKQDGNNYRKHSAENKRKIKKSIDEAGFGRSVVIDADGVLVCGNGVQSVIDGNTPVRVVETDGTELVVVKRTDLHEGDSKRKLLALADNATADGVEWDADKLVEDWGADALADWDVKVDWGEEAEAKEDDKKKEKDEQAEELLNQAMQQYCGEFADQIDIMLQHDMLITGLTEGFAKTKFIKAKYYGEKYPRYCSVIFTPLQFKTAGNKTSYYEQLRKSNQEGKAGIAGFRTMTSERCDNLTTLIKGSYPISDGRMPLDFPVEIVREMIKKYYNGGKMLDPCHGWGGRLVGAMLEDVDEYVGVDPSPVANKGVSRIAECFGAYSKTKSSFIMKPYEDVSFEESSFDFALTCPPYFDVEKYDGENTSTGRYNNYKLWKEGFYIPLFEKTYRCLKENSYFCIQVGGQKYPLINDGKEIAEKVGFKVVSVDNGKINNTLHVTDDENTDTMIVLQK